VARRAQEAKVEASGAEAQALQAKVAQQRAAARGVDVPAALAELTTTKAALRAAEQRCQEAEDRARTAAQQVPCSWSLRVIYLVTQLPLLLYLLELSSTQYPAGARDLRRRCMRRTRRMR
jgi:hypothetical protein